MTSERLIMIAVIFTVISVGGYVVAQPTPVTPDARTALNLAPSVEASLKQSMQEHLQALQAIVAELAQENYGDAAAIAHKELGFPKHHQVMQREHGVSFPKKYQELAIAHHQAAENLAATIATKEMKPILQKLDRTMKACVDCHQAYKLREKYI